MPSCALSETIVFTIILPMSKTAFLAVEVQYIASVAATAVVSSDFVNVLNIYEISTRSVGIMVRRSLLGTSVSVQTSVQVPYGQNGNLEDQSLLNSNLNKNGLPSGILMVNLSAPAPSPTAASGSVPTGAIIGGAIGLVVLIAAAFLYWRRTKVSSMLHHSPNDSICFCYPNVFAKTGFLCHL